SQLYSAAQSREASMRPQLFAAEIQLIETRNLQVSQASMRPQLFAAEIFQSMSPALRDLGFNEAAAIRCGDRPSLATAPALAFGGSLRAVRIGVRNVRRQQGVCRRHTREFSFVVKELAHASAPLLFQHHRSARGEPAARTSWSRSR